MTQSDGDGARKSVATVDDAHCLRLGVSALEALKNSLLHQAFSGQL